MEDTILSKVFDELKEKKLVTNQKDFGAALELTKGYVSILMRQSGTLSDNVKIALNKKFGVSVLWLASNGKSGTIWENEGGPTPIPAINSGDVRSSPDETIAKLLNLLTESKANETRLMAIVEDQAQTIGSLTSFLKGK